MGLWVPCFLVVAAALWAFAAIASEIAEGDTHAFDRAVLLALRNPLNHEDPLGPSWLEQVARDVTSLGGTTLLTIVTLIVSVYLGIAGRPAAAIFTAASVGGGALLSMLLKHSFDRPRPDLVPHLVDVYSASFPSGHAMLSAVTYLTLGALLARVQTRRRLQAYVVSCSLLLTVLVGVSRVYLGVHWPTDVIAGWCVGSAWAILCGLVALWLQQRAS